MCDLSNTEILDRWKEFHSKGQTTPADYWYEFMSKRVQCGREGSKAVLAEMSFIKRKQVVFKKGAK